MIFFEDNFIGLALPSGAVAVALQLGIDYI